MLKALKTTFVGLFCIALLSSCASSKLMEFKDVFDEEDEYDAVIAVESVEPVKEVGPKLVDPKKENSKKVKPTSKSKKGKKLKKVAVKTPKKISTKKNKKVTKKKSALIRTSVKKRGRKLPLIEDDEDFIGRRPKSDPFRVGEEATLSIKYLGVKAGELKLKVLPFKIVNGRKSYHFRTEIKSNSAYSMIYEVEDWAESYVDYETLLPFNYTVHVNHSNEKKQIKSVFDHPKNNVKVWEKKLGDDGKMKRRSYNWEMIPFSQNVISVFFYIRNFKLKVGKVIKFPLTDEDNNMILEAHVVGKEDIELPSGKMQSAFIVKPKVSIEGKFKPVGDVFLWFADNESKQILKVQSALKIGKLKFDIISIK